MTRSLLSMRILTVVGAVVLVACGPRLKPVEYEEPKLSGNGSPDDSEPSSGHKSKSAASASDSEGSSSGATASASGKKGGGVKCEDKLTSCGTPCSECAPGDMDCMEVLIEKQCNVDHKCVAAPANCSAPEKGDKKAKAKKE